MKRWSLLLALLFAACHGNALDAVGAVRGQLVMNDGAPLDGVAITLVGPTIRATQPDATGGFAIDEVPPGAYVLFVDAQDTKPRPVRRDVTIVAAQETTLDAIELTPTARARGRILVEGTTHHLGTTITSSDGSVTTTDDNGDFDVAVGLSAQTIVATHSGSRPLVLETTGLARGAIVELGTHTLVAGETPLFDVAGIVVVAGSTDRADVTVTIDPLGIEAKSDAAGNFVLPQISAGVYTLRFARGDMQEKLTNVLVGLDGAKVIASDVIFDLGVIELTAGKRLLVAPWESLEVTAEGELGVVRKGLNREIIELWDLASDTSLLTIESPADSFATSKNIAFDGDQIFVLSGASTTWSRRLLRIDVKTLTTTTIATDFSFAEHLPSTRTTGVTRRKAPDAPATYEIWSWDGGDPIVIDGIQSAARSERTLFFTSSDPSSPHTWRRASDGAILGSIEGSELVGQPAFSEDESTMAIVAGDHIEVLHANGTADKLLGTTAQPRFAGDVLWLSMYPSTLSARRLSDLSEIVAPMSNAAVLASHGATTLVQTWQSWGGQRQLTRYAFDGAGEYHAELIDLSTPNFTVTTTPVGFWVVGQTAMFIPLTGPVSAKHDTYMLSPNVAKDGSLLYLDATAATGSSLRRLTRGGEDTLVMEHVLDYSTVDDDLLVKATLGDRIESFLVRLATGEQRALGIDRVGATRIGPKAYYVSRSASDAQRYRDGLFRVGFSN